MRKESAEPKRANGIPLTASCSEKTAVSGHVSAFAKLLAQHEHPAGEHAALQEWIEAVTADGLSGLHGFVHGLEKDVMLCTPAST